MAADCCDAPYVLLVDGLATTTKHLRDDVGLHIVLVIVVEDDEAETLDRDSLCLLRVMEFPVVVYDLTKLDSSC